jgi:hypothetical protein
VGDKLFLPLIAAAPLPLAGGADGDNIQTWGVSGSAVGPLASWEFDPASPVAYSAGGLSMEYVAGTIADTVGSKFRFSVEGGQFQWRKNSGAWSSSLEILTSAQLITDGLSVAWEPGGAPSFVVDDGWTWLAVQPNRASNVVACQPPAWRWSGASATLLADLGSAQTVDAVAIAFQGLTGATVTLEGGADGVTWPFSQALIVRPGVMYAEFTAQSYRYWRLSLATAAAGYIGHWWLGEALTTEINSALELRRISEMARSDGYNPTALQLASAWKGRMSWSDAALREAEHDALLALVSALKSAGDHPMIMVPHYQRPADAYLMRVSVDEYGGDEIMEYRTDGTLDPGRRFALDLDLEGWRQ